MPGNNHGGANGMIPHCEEAGANISSRSSQDKRSRKASTVSRALVIFLICFPVCSIIHSKSAYKKLLYLSLQKGNRKSISLDLKYL